MNEELACMLTPEFALIIVGIIVIPMSILGIVTFIRACIDKYYEVNWMLLDNTYLERLKSSETKDINN